MVAVPLVRISEQNKKKLAFFKSFVPAPGPAPPKRTQVTATNLGQDPGLVKGYTSQEIRAASDLCLVAFAS